MWIRLWFCLLLSPAVLAGDSATYNRIAFKVTASAEIANDLLTVSLIARAEEETAEEAAKKVNQAMQSALHKAKKHPTIKASTLNYRTFPNYRESNIIGWQVEQGMQLESDKIAELAALTGELQGIVDVSEMKYKTSPLKRSKKENELIEDAIAAFEERAAIISGNLGAQKYRIVTMQLDTEGRYQDVPSYEAMLTKAQEQSAPLAPGIETGTQVIRVTVNGEIELISPR